MEGGGRGGTLGWRAVVFCVWELLLLFPIVFCLVGTVHKFHLGMFKGEYLRDRYQWKVVDAVTGTNIATGPVYFLWKVSL